MNNSIKINSLIGLSIILLIVVIVLVISCIFKKTKDIEKEFLNDMNKNLNGPIYDIIKKLKNYDDIIKLIYKNNKQQIDSVYIYAKNDFEGLIKSNCLHDELMYKILEIVDKIIFNVLSAYSKDVIILFLTVVYLYYEFSPSPTPPANRLEEMCSILACDSLKPNILVTQKTGTPITKNDLIGNSQWPGNALFTKTGNVSSTFLHFYSIFNNNHYVLVNVKLFAEYNKTTIIPVLNKIKSDLDKTVCEKDSNKSTYNAAHNLLDVINKNIAEILIKEFFPLSFPPPT